MPIIRYFIVEQVRQVRVSANTLTDAAKIADAAFRGEAQEENVKRFVMSEIKEISLNVREDF